MTKHKKKLVIISGARRGIGKSFFDKYQSISNTICIGISRKNIPNLVQIDLLEENSTYSFTKELNLNNVNSILYFHSIGIDKFEPKGLPQFDYDNDGIDDDVYKSNVTTFLNIAEPLIDRSYKVDIPITICNIGSISDIFEVPYWQSFSKSKNIIRKFMKSLNDESISNVVLNISSTLDEENRKYGRTNADTTYWQTTQEFLTKSFGFVDGIKDTDASYMEIDIYKHNPSFKTDYFVNLPKLYASWQKDMGLEGKEIPLGIRI